MITVILEEFVGDDIDNLDNDIEEITIKIGKMRKDITNLPASLKKVILSFEDSPLSSKQYFLHTTNEQHVKYYVRLPFGCKLYLEGKTGINEIMNFSGYIYEIPRTYRIFRTGDLIYQQYIN